MEQWGPTAVGTLLVVVIGAAVAGWLKVKDKQAEVRRQESDNERERLKLEHQLAREDTEQVKKDRLNLDAETKQLLAKLHKDLEGQRNVIHRERGERQKLGNEVYICQLQRGFMARQIKALVKACEEAKLHLVMPEMPEELANYPLPESEPEEPKAGPEK